MNSRRLLLAVACAALNAVSAELPYDPFPPFASVPAAERVARTGTVEIAPDGTFVENGRPRYYPATCWYGGFEFLAGNNGGACDALDWLYDRMPDYEAMTRLGFDATGLSCTFKWMRAYRPRQKEFPCDWKKSLSSFKCGLPLYMDFTASEWGLGSMNLGDRPLDPAYTGTRGKWPDEIAAARRRGPSIADADDDELALDDPEDKPKAEQKAPHVPAGYLGPEAFTVGHNHWVPYSVVHPKGRKIWLDMWTGGAREVLDLGLHPWCYELFNEPSVYDRSDWAKTEFDARLTARFGADGIRALSDLARSIEYSKFVEERFASLLAEGTAALKALDPSARTTFQPCTIRTRGLDLYRCYRELDVVCSQTGGRGIMEAHMLRGLADGKPIVDNEMYIGNSTNAIRQSYLDQYQRGFNMSMAFKWSADKSGYNFMNRTNVRPDALLGVRLAKRDILDVNEFFTPRDRGVPRETAVLFSNPTERLAQHRNHDGYRFFDQAVVGIDGAQLPMDVLWEEDVTNTTARLSRYKLLVVAGADAAYPGTRVQIEKWVRAGGRLLCLNRRLDCDEYGTPDPKAFTASLPEGESVVGKGRVRIVTGRMSAEQIGALAVAFGAGAGVKPCCTVTDAFDGSRSVFPVEVHPAMRDGLRAWTLTARTLQPVDVRFTPSEPVAALIRVWSACADGDIVSFRRETEADAQGGYVFTLEPNQTILLVGGPKAALAARYPGGTTSRWLPPRSAAYAREEAQRARAARTVRAARARTRFAPDVSRVVKLDLAQVANSDLKTTLGVDAAAKGGAGAVVWGAGTFEGVPMDVLRYDQNNGRDCVRLTAGRSVRLALPPRVGSLYVLGTGALTGTLRYADGGTCAVAGGAVCRVPAVWRWCNAEPEREVTEVELTSSAGAVLVAATVEKPARVRVAIPGDNIRPRGMNSKGVSSAVTNGVWEVTLDESAASWSTTGINFIKPVPIAPGSCACLTFEMNRLPDTWGNYHDHATPQLRINCLDARGGFCASNWLVPKHAGGTGAFFYRTDADPETWERAALYVSDGAIPKQATQIVSIALQFQQMPAERSGLAFRHFELERADERPAESAAEPERKKTHDAPRDPDEPDGLDLDF